MTPSPPPPTTTTTTKPQPTQWTHQETITLITSYHNMHHHHHHQHHRPLTTSLWSHIATFLPSKSPTQCRHKLDKLRKRYRLEKLKQPSTWPYFPFLHQLETGAPLMLPTPPPGNDPGTDTRSRDGERELGGVMREFAEMFLRLERSKMEFIRETERCRVDLENRRLEMVLVSHQRTVDMVSKVFSGEH